MTWDSCTGPLDKTTTVGASYDLYISVIGQDERHKAYDVRFWYGNSSQEVPDAWRFDADGCETPEYIKQDVQVFGKTCPAFMQGGRNLQIKDVEFSPPTDNFALTLMRVLLANAYAPPDTVNPATRYLLERIRFDLTDAVGGGGSPPATCGGFEQPMCFKLGYATFLDLNGIEISFFKPYWVTGTSFNGPSACPALPVRATTWGSIRSQYRY